MQISAIGAVSKNFNNNINKIQKQTFKGFLHNNSTQDEFSKSFDDFKDEEIKNEIQNVKEKIKGIQKLSKINYKIAKKTLKISKKNNYENYSYLNKKDRTKLIFEKSENEEIPRTITEIGLKGGMHLKKTYKFEKGLKLFSATYYKENGILERMIFENGKLIHYLKANKNTGKQCDIVISKNSFLYNESNINSNGEIIQTNKAITIDNANPKSDCYISQNSERLYEIYKLNSKTKTWEYQFATDNLNQEV